MVWSPSLIGAEPSEQQDPLPADAVVVVLPADAVVVVLVVSLVGASELQQVKSRPLSHRIAGRP